MPATAPLPVRAQVAAGVLAAGLAGLVWSLARFWGANPEYADRFLILAAAGWAAWQARPGLAAVPPRPARVGYLPLAAGAAAFPVGWFLQAQVAPKPVVLWWVAGAWLLAAAGTVLVWGGWGHLRRLAFPLLFVLFALPIPNRVLVPLQHFLQSATTAAAAAALPALGVPTARVGFELHLPGGELRVVEACSGVRSVTALTAIAAFVAHLSGFGPARGLALLALSVPVIAAVNAVRVVASGLIQERAGPQYLRGSWHDALGVLMVLLGLGLVLLLARALRGTTAAQPTSLAPAPAPAAAPAGRAPGLGPTVILSLAGAAAVAAHLLGAAAEREAVATAPLAEIPYSLGGWAGRDLPIPDEIAGMLTYDAAVQRVYGRPLEDDLHVWVIFWSSQNMVKGYHHPDVCWPKRDFREAYRETADVRPAGGGVLPVTVREFVRKGDRRLVLYWTQEGRRVWTAEDERAVEATGDSHNWLADRLLRRGEVEATGRLVVLIGTPTRGDGAAVRAGALGFARDLAGEVYRLCPWAALR